MRLSICVLYLNRTSVCAKVYLSSSHILPVNFDYDTAHLLLTAFYGTSLTFYLITRIVSLLVMRFNECIHDE